MANNYGEDYYSDYAEGGAYLDTPEITKTLRALARWISNSLYLPQKTRTHLDVGCAFGVLVEAMARLGWNTAGIDSSTYAIANAVPGALGRIVVGDASKLAQSNIGHSRCDVVTCIEVLEHMTEPDSDAAIEAMCLISTRYIVFSSKVDYVEKTHINVHEQNYWDDKFIQHGFVPLLYRFNKIPWLRVYQKTDSYKTLSAMLDRITRQEVYERDRFCCAICGKSGVQVHEIVPRSAFGRRNMHVCFSVENRICLCPEHHNLAHTIEQRKFLIGIQQKRFGYKYENECFMRYKED